MKLFLILVITSSILSCNSQTDSNAKLSAETVAKPVIPDFAVALKFINDYASYCAAENAKRDDVKWIEGDSLLTTNFKQLYRNMVDSARKKDPELGLDSDPIFDAQDFPQKGFTILTADTAAGYVTMNGIDWKDFQLVLKLKRENDKWLVDGAGVINVPPDKRAKRE